MPETPGRPGKVADPEFGVVNRKAFAADALSREDLWKERPQAKLERYHGGQCHCESYRAILGERAQALEALVTREECLSIGFRHLGIFFKE
jgi:hypothetical protein